MSPRVFVVQQPTRRSPAGVLSASMDLSPAASFGPLIFLLPVSENPFRNLTETLAHVRWVMAENEYGPSDFLLLVGNPCLIGVAAMAAAERTHLVRFLQWQRTAGQYAEASAHLGVLDPEADAT